MIDYQAINKECRRLKGRLTKVLNMEDPQPIIDEVDYAEKIFEDNDWPLPDGWARWRNAKSDAELQLRRSRA